MNRNSIIKQVVISAFILAIFSNLLNAQTSAQKLKQGLKDGKDILRGGKAVINELDGIVKTTKKTSKDIKSTVQVIKGDDAEKIRRMPKDQLTPLKIKRGKIQNMEWEPFVSMDNQLFPSALVTLSGYKGQTTNELELIIRPIGIKFKSQNLNIPIKWEIECTDKKFFDKITGTCLYDQVNQQIIRNPNIPWNIETLAKQDASTPMNFIFRIFDDEGNKSEKTLSAYMRSVDDCIRYCNEVPLRFLYTAYIQEEHPEIRKILKEATDTKMISSIGGYQGNVDAQVCAIWRVLHERGINYGSITTTAGGNKGGVYSQVVRTFDKSINDKQANCVDGTVVFASILRKMGIHSVLVLVQGHCFLGYYRKKDDAKGNRQDLVFLETTMLDGDKFINEAKEKARAIKDPKKANEMIKLGYMKQFISAQLTASDEYKEYKQNNTIEELIDVDRERMRFTKPIPFYIN